MAMTVSAARNMEYGHFGQNSTEFLGQLVAQALLPKEMIRASEYRWLLSNHTMSCRYLKVRFQWDRIGTTSGILRSKSSGTLKIFLVRVFTYIRLNYWPSHRLFLAFFIEN